MIPRVIGSPVRRVLSGKIRRCVRRFAAILALVVAALVGSAAAATVETEKDPSVLSSILRVRTLTKEEAQRGRPVKVRGVVTYYDPKWDTLFIQDDSAGTYVYPTQRVRPRYEPGQLLEVEGRTVAGAVANSIIEEKIAVLGMAPLPTPRSVSYAQMGNGKLDSQWVELEGTVRGITAEWQRMEIDLSVNGGRLRAHLPRPPGLSLPVQLMHARVRVRGVCGTIFNQADEVVGVRMFVPGPDYFTVVSPAVAEAFQLPLTAMTNVFAGNPHRISPSLVRIAGVVTLRWPSGKVFLQDGTNGVEIELAKPWKMIDPEGITYPNPAPTTFGPGDRVEAVGYPSLRESGPVLEESEVRMAGQAGPIDPARIEAGQAANGSHAAQLVQLEARLVDELPYDPAQPGVHRYRLENGGITVEGHLESDPLTGLAALRGSLLKLTGVCAPSSDRSATPRTVRLFLRNPLDAVVLHGPPFWGRQEMLRAVGGAAIVLTGLLAWMLFLWYQGRQKSALNQQLEASIRSRTGELVAANEQLQREVAERSRAQAALQESQARIRTIVEHNPEAIVVFDVDAGRFVEVNENAARLFGMKRDDLLERGPAQLSPSLQPDGSSSESAAREKMKAALADECPVFEWTHRNSSGKDFPCEVRLARLPAETRRLVVGTLTNITERKRAAAELRESAQRLRQSEERFSRAFHASPALVSLARLSDGAFVEVNETCRKLSGYAEAEILGRTSIDLGLWVDRGRRSEFLDLLKEQGSVRDRECLMRSKEGRLYTVLLSGELIEVNGEPYVLTVGVDITARKQAEQELLKSLVMEKELGELKSNFVSMVSHEFRTPLGIIQSSAEILDRYLERLAPEDRREHLDAINQSVRRMSRLMEEVLLLSKVEAGRMRCAPAPVDLAVFCRGIVDETLSATHHQCPVRFEAGPIPALSLADENLLRHIFTNLLSNAVKYSPAGAAVDFRVGIKNGRTVFEVRDRGLGIPAADQPRMFKAFHRGNNVTHLAGTGLGLTIVKRCVDLHGGTIEFESAEGAGAAFTVTLPLGSPPQAIA